jgi:YVTN family beta-propeller protein
MLKKILFLVALSSVLLPSAFAQALGTINTVAGGVPNNVPALSVGIADATAVVKDSSGNLYVAVGGTGGGKGGAVAGGIFKIDTTGTLTTFVGNGTLVATASGNNGDGGPASDATVGFVTGLFLDSQQNLYISDNFYGTIRKVTASTGIINTIAGGGTGCAAQTDTIGDGCPATSAILSTPYQIFLDANQNLFIADTGHNRIRGVVASTGLMQTVAGGGTGCPNQTDTVGDGCAAALATLSSPIGVYLDSHNDVYISDTGNSRMREVNAATGLIQTIAGTGTPGYNGDGIAANAAQISSPYGLFVDPSGNVFFADGGNGRVREIVASSSLIETLAGPGSGCIDQTDSVGDGCPAGNAVLDAATGVFIDASNDLYIADSDNHLVREVVASDGVLASTDTIQAVAGNGTEFFSGDGQLATNAELDFPYGVAVGASGNLIIADSFNDRIRKVIATTGIIQTVAGGGTGCAAQTDTLGDGCLPTQATLSEPIAVFVDGAGNHFISDYGNNRIRKISASTGIITTVAGGGSGCDGQTDPVGDGCPATQAILSSPWGAYADAAGNIFFSDLGNSRIREVVASTGLIQTIAGTGTNGYNGENIPAVQAEVNSPTGLYGDSSGNIYISDTGNSRIREVFGPTPPAGKTSGNIVTVAGTGTPGYNGDNILATSAEIIEPLGVFVDRSGNFFFGDYGNNRVREVVASTGLIQTVAGDGTFGFSGDGGPATSAEVSYLAGMAGDPNGNLFLADTFNFRIRELFGVVPADALAVTTPSLPAGQIGIAYSLSLQAVNGIPPYSWSITSGALPSTLSLNASTGVISGSPAAAASYPLTIQVADSATPAHTASANYTLNVQALSAFSGLTPSQSIPAGTSSVTLGGTIGSGTTYPTPGETVSITINGVKQAATIGSNGTFSTAFATATIPGSATPYTITYAYAGDATLTSATDTSTTLTVTGTAVTLQTITVTPANPNLAVNATQTFLAIGTYSDGSTKNLAGTVTWSSGTTTVATISTSGVATGVAAGTSTISATLGNAVGSTVLTVVAGPPYAYLGSITTANCCLDVLNTSTNLVVKTIPITNFNAPFGITPNQSRVYVADNVNNLLNVVDTTTNTLMTTIPIGVGPTAVAITPDGLHGYVADLGDNNVPVFSVATNALVTNIPVGFPTTILTASPDGAWVYASSAVNNTFAVINTSTNTASSFTVGASTSCVTGPTFNPAGTLAFIAEQTSCSTFPPTTTGFLDVVSVPTNSLVAAIPVGIEPIWSAITPDGAHLYVSNTFSNTVSVIDTATHTVIATVPVGTAPQTLAVTPDGASVYVLNAGSSTVSVIQVSTNTVTSTISVTTPFGIVIASPPPASQATTLALTPPNLIFNSQVTGTISAAQTINVTNPGATPVTLTSVALTGPNVSDFSLVNACPVPPATLAGGASCGLQVSFRPSATGALTALVTITNTNGLASSQQSAPLSGNGTGSTLATFSGLTPSQTITAGAASISLAGVIGNETTFPAAGETVSVTINGVTQAAVIGTAGAFSTTFATSTIPASATPYTITYSYAGDAIFAAATNTSTTLTVNAPPVFWTLTVTDIGTGNGTVTDNLEEISCTTTAGVQSGTCSASYLAGTVVALTATPSGSSTFAGWGNACTGTAGCSVTMNSPQAVTASFAPPPQLIPVTFNTGTNSTGMATYNCPSNPAPSPGNPCTDTNAHAMALTIGQVLQPITLTVQASEVPPSTADGICPNGLGPLQDFDCRFTAFFTFQTLANGNQVVPLCYPYANGNCVHYQVYSGTPGVEPNPSFYVGPIDWMVSWNNDTFTPPAPYAGSTPHLYDDPDYAVSPTSPYGTDCTTPMLVGNPPVATNPPIYCQFEFDITTGYFPIKKVDAAITGRTKQFNDVVVAFPPANVGSLSVTEVPLAATVTAGSPIGYTITVSNSAGGAVTGATLNDVLPAGTNVNWTISPAYNGPGTCAIAGAVGSQVLSCSFGSISASQSFTIGLLSAGSSTGTYTDTTTTVNGTQQILSIGTLTVQGVATFSGLTPSQTISYATSSINLSGTVGSGTTYPTTGETVSIMINGVTQTATIGSNGAFSTTFPTTAIPASTTPYTITYSYAGDATLTAATDTSTTLTETGYASQIITFTGAPATAVYSTTFAVSASASSGLPVTITASGVCSISGGTVTMTSGTGACTLTASQLGNGIYSPAQASKTVTAAKAASTTTITSNAPNPSNAFQSVAIAFSVTGVTTPTGSVTVTASTGESCSAAISSGSGSCSITFATAGSRTLVATYSGDTNFNTSASASVSQTVNSTSSLAISPASIDFGQIPLGWFSIKTVTLSNTGTTAITIFRVDMSRSGSGDFDDFFVLSLCPRMLAAGRSCALEVGYLTDRDDPIGSVSSTSVVITDSAAGSPQSVPVKAMTINPKAGLSSIELEFQNQKLGTTSSPQTVTLTSTGTSPLILNSVSIDGDFTLASGTTCAADLSLAPTKSCKIVVEFKPTRIGVRIGSVNITDNALFQEQFIRLTGTGE